MKKKKITYSQTGDDYYTKDPIKKIAQAAARKTSANLSRFGFFEIEDSRGESAFVWKQGRVFMASVVEGLGTKNLVADATRKITGKTYYDVIGHDTVATIINDLATVGARPLVVHAYWAIEDNSFLQDEKRMKDLVNGWRLACDLSQATWGGGETPTLKGIIAPQTIELGGSAIGIIKSRKRLLSDKKLKIGDRILLLGSSGINANGLSLARAVAKKLKHGYETKLSDGTIYGEALLNKTNIYAKLVEALLNKNIDLHYISNITGHGLRKIMRARQNYTYVLENIFAPAPIFLFIQEHAGLSDYEAYETFNMGADYALFLAQKDVVRATEIIKKQGFTSMDAGYVSKGKRQVVIQSKKIVYKSETLDLR